MSSPSVNGIKEEIIQEDVGSGSESPKSLRNKRQSKSRLSHHKKKEENGTNDELSVKVPIIGFETMEERAKFTVFKLRVENEKLEENWLVFRRYTDFVRLHTKLKEEVDNLQTCLPPKRWLRDNFETAFLEERMKGLQAFVDSILVQQQLAELPTVRKFFCLDEPPVYSDCAEESRSWFGTMEDSSIMLKHKLTERDREIELLRAELALVTTQRDNILKITKNCRHCSQKQSCNSPNSGRNTSNLLGSPKSMAIPSSSSSSDHGSCSPRRTFPLGESHDLPHPHISRSRNSPTSSRRSSNASSSNSPSHSRRQCDSETLPQLNRIPEDFPNATTSSSTKIDADKEDNSILSVTIKSISVADNASSTILEFANVETAPSDPNTSESHTGEIITKEVSS